MGTVKSAGPFDGTAFRLAVALAAGFTLLSGCAGVAVPPGAGEPAEAPALPGFIRGVLAVDNALAVSAAGATVRIGGVRAAASPDGSFSLPQVPPGKYSLVAEKRFGQGSVRRVLGISTVYVGDSRIEVRVRLRDATDVDAYCSDCHPVKQNVARRDQVVRDVHPSGVVPRKANKPTGRFDERGRVTCESCHTLHEPTPHPHYLLGSYRDGKICLDCH